MHFTMLAPVYLSRPSFCIVIWLVKDFFFFFFFFFFFDDRGPIVEILHFEEGSYLLYSHTFIFFSVYLQLLAF